MADMDKISGYLKSLFMELMKFVRQDFSGVINVKINFHQGGITEVELSNIKKLKKAQ